MSVNLTTMLVMTTIFISKMESLPPTSDIKMIDIWLILCQLVPFVEVVILTGIEYHREAEEDSWTNHHQAKGKGKGTKSMLCGNLAQSLEIVGESPHNIKQNFIYLLSIDLLSDFHLCSYRCFV